MLLLLIARSIPNVKRPTAQTVVPEVTPGAVWVVMVSSAQGALLVPLAVPNVPRLQNVVLWFQAVSSLQLPLHASTRVGGLIR